jgi:cytochrome c oxidase subunit 1
VAIASSAEVCQSGDAQPHLPAQSYWPITLAFGMPIVGYGLIFNLGLAFVGAAIMLIAIYGWVLEPAFGHGGHGDDGGHHDGPEPEPDAEADAPAEPATETEETPVG